MGPVVLRDPGGGCSVVALDSEVLDSDADLETDVVNNVVVVDSAGLHSDADLEHVAVPALGAPDAIMLDTEAAYSHEGKETSRC